MYERQIATAKRLIANYGAAVQWTKPAVGALDPEKPWRTDEGAPTVYPGVAVCVFTRGAPAAAFLQALKGTDVYVGKSYAFMAPQAFFPQMADFFTMPEGKVWNIAAIDELAPNGTPILYTLELRG